MLASKGWGGAERLGCTLFRMAREAGHDVRLEVLGSQQAGAGLRSDLGDDDAAHVGESELWSWARETRRLVATYDPDVIHAHLAWPSLASAVVAVVGRRPHILTFHLLPSGQSWPKDLLVRVPSQQVVRWVRRLNSQRVLTAVSAADSHRLQATFPRDRVELVLNAPPLPPLVTEAPELRWPPGAVRLLSVARICRQKGLDRLAQALASPALRVLPWYWTIVGDGDARPALERQLAELGISERVGLAGALPAHSLFNSADLMLAPSRWEGMPLVPLEAVQSGVPIVASPIPPHVELFADIPLALLPHAEQEWPGALSRLIANESARTELRSRQAALVPKLGRERMWREYDVLYRELGRQLANA